MVIQSLQYAITFATIAFSLLSIQVQSYSTSHTATSNPGGCVASKTASPIAFETLSKDPLMFQSTKPILDKHECGILSKWCKHLIETRGDLEEDSLEQGIANREEGALLLRRVQEQLHMDLLGLDEKDDEMVLPRYIFYTEWEDGIQRYESSKPKDTKDYTLEDLLPGGLHVDTNNSKFFRHWTILLYLDSCDTLGATSFPLAVPELDDSEITDDDDEQLMAATKLLANGVQHTRFIDATEEELEFGRIVERPSLSLLSQQDNPAPSGIRVSPKHGHYCLFSNLNENGFPNPRSFHGSEALYHGESKDVLTFFYEIPVGTFTSREQLGQRAMEREDMFLRKHGLLKTASAKVLS